MSVITMLRLGVLCLCFIVTLAQNDELQAFMEETQAEYKMLGMAVGAFQGSEWIMKGQIGVRHADDPTPVGENDKFYLSDAGRSIVSMLAARVIEQSEGELTWQSTLGEVFQGSMTVPDPFTDATLLELLLHSGHILDFEQVMRHEDLMNWYDMVWGMSQWADPALNADQRWNMANFLVNIGCYEQEDELCVKGRYSKFTYSVAVSMLEMFTGKTFNALLTEYVFDPLDAPDCGVGPTTLDQSLPPAQPWSHFSGPWGVYNIPVVPGDQSEMPSSIAPDDGLHCSLESWKNVMSAHLTKPQAFLSEDSWSVLQTAGVLLYDEINYAPGFVVDNSNPFVTTLYHPGGDQKTWSTVYIVPEAQVGLVVAANQNLQDGMRQKVGADKIMEYVGKQLSGYAGITIKLNSMKNAQELVH